MRKKLVAGVGVTDIPMKDENGKTMKSYQSWQHMLNRCYSEKIQEIHPTYKGCLVSYEWLTYSNFKKFYDTNYKEGFQLDKDILIRGNKEYSEKACRFVPAYINLLLIDRGAKRGEYKIGVDFYNGKFRSQCNNGTGKQKYLGYYENEEEAFQAYKEFKEQTIKRIAQSAYGKGDIDIDIYHALLKWEITG